MNHNSVQEEVVKPRYERGDKTIVTNSGPVSLLTFFSKVPKTAMHSTLNQHLRTMTYWSQDSTVLGKGYKLKMLPSD